MTEPPSGHKAQVRIKLSFHSRTLMAGDNLHQKISERINIKKGKILSKEQHKREQVEAKGLRSQKPIPGGLVLLGMF